MLVCFGFSVTRVGFDTMDSTENHSVVVFVLHPLLRGVAKKWMNYFY